MKYVVTGTSGLVGSDVYRELSGEHEVWGIGRRRPDFVPLSQWRTVDIVDADLTTQTIHQINPDCVIHSAALSNPDDCEADPETAYKANALGTRNIALACQRFDAEMVYISTDQVFDGKKGAPYTEIDIPTPLHHYGKSKLWGEHFVQTLLRRFYIVRTALVFGGFRPTFVDRVAKCAASGESVTAATDIVNSPTYSKDLAQALHHLTQKHIYGLYNITNEGHTSRYDLARFIAESLSGKTNFIKKGTLKHLKLKAKRPGTTPLQNFVWNLNGFPKMRSWKEAVLSFLEEMPGPNSD